MTGAQFKGSKPFLANGLAKMESPCWGRNERGTYRSLALASYAMKSLIRFLAIAGSVASISVTTVQPAFAQWGSYGLSRQQVEIQRGNGWSSGDYFGSGGGSRNQSPRVNNDYQPGMDRNISYPAGSCGRFINC